MTEPTKPEPGEQTTICIHCEREIRPPDNEHPWWHDEDKYLPGLCQHNPKSRYHVPQPAPAEPAAPLGDARDEAAERIRQRSELADTSPCGDERCGKLIAALQSELAEAREKLAAQSWKIYHHDDRAILVFGSRMAAKMGDKRAEGKDGWEESTPEFLAGALFEHLPKGDPVDIANFCMMLSINGVKGNNRYIADHLAAHDSEVRRAALEEACKPICPLCAGSNKFVQAIPVREGSRQVHIYDDTGQFASICMAEAIRSLMPPTKSEDQSSSVLPSA